MNTQMNEVHGVNIRDITSLPNVNSMSKLGVHLNIIDESYAPFPRHSIGF
jgi:hypothetical protein